MDRLYGCVSLPNNDENLAKKMLNLGGHKYKIMNYEELRTHTRTDACKRIYRSRPAETGVQETSRNTYTCMPNKQGDKRGVCVWKISQNLISREVEINQKRG